MPDGLGYISVFFSENLPMQPDSQFIMYSQIMSHSKGEGW